jgi:D-arabinose 1-dehydrogenase-like Zn-dependent alcohol dehydrogenase
VRSGGVVAVVGGLDSFDLSFSAVDIFLQAKRLEGVYVGSAQMLKELIRFCTEHRVTPVVDRVFPFDQAEEAFRYFASSQHVGKVVIDTE